MTDEKKAKNLNYLMNKISLVLKDATLQHGFEIICKKLAELEKENAELKKHIIEVENDSNNCEHWSYERIKQLEEQIEKMKCCENCKKHRNRECSEDMKFYARVKRECNQWEQAE